MGSILGIPSKTYDYINDFGMNVYVLGILVIVLVVYYLFFSKLVTDTTTGEKSIYASFLEVGLWAVFIVLVLLNGAQYFFNINFVTEISSIFSNSPKVDVKVKDADNYDAAPLRKDDKLLDLNGKPISGGSKTAKEVGGVKDATQNNGGTQTAKETEGTQEAKAEAKAEDNVMADAKKTVDKTEMAVDEKTTVKLSGKDGVFHIPENRFTYDDSQKVCKAYGARLATYNEVEEAYKDGGNWCSYGWTDKQMVLYPTQKKHWEKLQTIEGHENDCGRPGVNGGYIDNPNAHFGINCYGKRPEATEEDKVRMKNTVIYPRTKEEIAFEKDVENWKAKLPDIEVAPFSHDKWHP